MSDFVMPSLGADMTAGTLIAWMKTVGERLNRGDIIAEVDTDKGVIEVEVFTSGVVEELLVKEGEKVPVGTAMARIKEDVEPQEIGSAVEMQSGSIPEMPTRKDYGVSPSPAETQRVRISPVARKLAERLGIELSKVKATGPGGRIQREDVEAAAKELGVVVPQVSDTRFDEDRSARMRRAIGAAMSRSKRDIPHYYLATTVDITNALDWLERENSNRKVKDRILPNVLLLKAVSLGLRQTPEMNAVWENGELDIKETINVGTAISLRQGGLVAPALRNTDKQDLDELMKNLRDLVQRTRAGTLRSSELADSTITVTDLGEHGVESVFGVIYPPQVALVGFGRPYESVSVFEGRIKGCFKINVTLAADHRASDGHRGSLFLAAIDKLLQDPEKL